MLQNNKHGNKLDASAFAKATARQASGSVMDTESSNPSELVIISVD